MMDNVSDIFAITNNVNKGCVLAYTIFLILLSAMLEEAFRDMGDGVYIQAHQNTDLFTAAHKYNKYTYERTAFRKRQLTDCQLEEIQGIVDAFTTAS